MTSTYPESPRFAPARGFCAWPAPVLCRAHVGSNDFRAARVPFVRSMSRSCSSSTRRVSATRRASLHTLQHARVLADPSAWLSALRDRPSEYPERLRRNIVAHNHQVPREALPSYGNQLVKALRRADSVSVNHRLAGLLASYFDILLAINALRAVGHVGTKAKTPASDASCTRTWNLGPPTGRQTMS